jgi:phosphatidylinositol alpha-mannosyltransferase
VPVIGTFHTNFGRSVGYRLSRGYFQRRLDRLAAAICVSPTAARANERYFEADWTIIPNGIDTSVFHPAAPRPNAIHPEIPTILFLGRFDPRNGLATLFDAFRKVRGARRPARLVVVGDGPLRKHYHRLAAGDRDIVFVGSVLDGRAGYYANSTIYACPTTKASFGITLLESMACATPIVCSDIEGFTDVVQDGREAIMTPCGSVDALADALARLLDDDVLRARLGNAGRERAMDFSWSSVADQVLEVYEKTIGASIAVA